VYEYITELAMGPLFNFWPVLDSYIPV